MLLHCVFCHFDAAHSQEARDEVLAGFGTLTAEVEGMLAYEYGPNRDFEAKTPDHSDGFVIKFTDRDAHLAYERHPKHVELGTKLVSMCVGGAEGILVYDLEIAGA